MFEVFRCVVNTIFQVGNLANDYVNIMDTNLGSQFSDSFFQWSKRNQIHFKTWADIDINGSIPEGRTVKVYKTNIEKNFLHQVLSLKKEYFDRFITFMDQA